MPMKIRKDLVNKFASKCEHFKSAITESFGIAGEAVRDEIVKTTLQGIGEGDIPFKPYSPAYQKLIDSVGGKPGGRVDLRGIFLKRSYKGGKKFTFKDKKREANRQRRALSRGAGRRAYIQVVINGRSFLAQTNVTRPRMGLNDPQSEMSADLIQVIIGKNGFHLKYVPRQKDYMIDHNVDRPWFSTNKRSVRDALAEVLSGVFRAAVREFNSK